MSQSHIPQPDTAAPGEQIQSTDSVPAMQSIEVPSPSNAGEIVPAMGEFNGLDPYFYNQFRQIAKIRWTVQDVAGKLLWYIPLNPLAMDKNLAHICRCYLAWNGDFQFNFKVAGTGFHAGLLTFVKTPPTLHPERLTNPQDFSFMPWDAVDPKMLEIGSMYGRDIRPIKYHYMQKQPDAPADYYLGGYLALYVDIPLNTSASGTPRIELAIWVRNAPNFKVAWMVPFDLQEITPMAVAPPILDHLLNFAVLHETQMLSSYPIDVSTIEIMPAELKILNKHVYNCIKLDTSPMSMFAKDDPKNLTPPNVPWAGILTGAVVEKGTKAIFDKVYPFWQGNTTFNTAAWSSDQLGMMQIKDPLTEVINNDRWLSGVAISVSKDPAGKDDRFFIYPPANDIAPTKITDNEYKASTSDESFLLFGAGSNGYVCPQFYALSEAFIEADINGIQQWIPPGQSAIFQMIEYNSKLPLTFVRLNREGFFTAPASTDKMKFAFRDISFRFLFMLPVTEGIPSNSHITNLRMAALFYERSIRKKQKSTSRK